MQKKQDSKREVDELREGHQRDLEEKDRLHQVEMDVLRERLQQVESTAQPREAVGARGGVQDPIVSSQKPREAVTQPSQSGQARSPVIVAITEENRSQVSTKLKGLLANPNGTFSMTHQFKTWLDNQEIQMEKLFKVAPPHPENINNDGHPLPTRKNLEWTHTGDWIDVPYSVHDKGPKFKETLVARMERSINTDGVIERSLSYGDSETKLKVWYDITEMLAAFPHWDVPSPSIYPNTRKLNPNRKKPKEANKPPPPTRDRGRYQNSRGRGRGGYGRYGEQYGEWNRQQSGGGNQNRSYDQPRQQQQRQRQHHQQQGPVPPPAMHQQYQQYPTQAPVHSQQMYNPVPIPATGPQVHYQYHHPSPMIGDQYQHQYSDGGVRPKEGHSRPHRDTPREYSRERRPYRASRDTQRRDSRDRGNRRYPSQDSDYRDSQQGYNSRDHERRWDDSQERGRNLSRERRHGNRSKSTKRRNERTPSPTNSGIGRGGTRRDRDQAPRQEEGGGRGRSNQDKRESDASYGES